MNSRDLTLGEAAKKLGLTPQTLRQAIQSGRLPARLVPVTTHEYRITLEDLETWNRRKRRGRPLDPSKG